jgi:hypothetical protein
MSSTAMPAVDLQTVISELSAPLFSASPSLAAFEERSQEHLSKNDELLALVDSARLEIQHTTDVAFANLLSQTQVRCQSQRCHTPPFEFDLDCSISLSFSLLRSSCRYVLVLKQ